MAGHIPGEMSGLRVTYFDPSCDKKPTATATAANAAPPPPWFLPANIAGRLLVFAIASLPPSTVI